MWGLLRLGLTLALVMEFGLGLGCWHAISIHTGPHWGTHVGIHVGRSVHHTHATFDNDSSAVAAVESAMASVSASAFITVVVLDSILREQFLICEKKPNQMHF